MLDITTDLTRLTRHTAKVPSNFDWSSPLRSGEWVALNNDDTIARITSDHGTPNTFPIWTPTNRHDVHGSETVTLIVGPFMAWTNEYIVGTGNTLVGFNTSLHVTGDSTTPGRLARATSGDLIRAHVMRVDSAENKILVRLIDGYATA